LARPTHLRRVQVPGDPLSSRQHLEQPPGAKRLRLSLRDHRLDRLGADGVSEQEVGGLAQEHAIGSATVTLHRGPGIVEVARQQRFEDLGVVRLAERGGADEVAEERGDDPALGTQTAEPSGVAHSEKNLARSGFGSPQVGHRPIERV
jgi:hypothetical protein